MPTSVSTGGRRSFRRILRFAPLAGIGLVLLAAALLPLKSERLKSWALDQISDQLGRKVAVGDVRLQFLPRVHLDLSEVALYEPAADRKVFQARRITLILRLRPLVSGQLAVKRLTIDGPRIDLRRNSNGQWNGGTPEAPSGPEGEIFRDLLAALSRIKETVVKHGEIRVVETGGGAERALHLREFSGRLTTASGGLPFQLSLSTRAEFGTGTMEFMLAGRIRQASEPLHMAPDIPTEPKIMLGFDGMASVETPDAGAMARGFGVMPASAASLPPARLKTAVHLTPGAVGYDMVLSELHADMTPLSLQGELGLFGLLTEHPVLRARVASSPMALEDAIRQLPLQKLVPAAHQFMNEHAIGGTVELLNFRGTWTPGSHPPDVSGTLRIRDGQAVIGAARTPVRQASGIVDFGENAVHVTEVTGLYGPLRVTGGTAALAFGSQAPRWELAITGDVSAQGLVTTLLDLDLSKEVNAALGQVREAQGQATVALRLAGNPSKPDAIVLSRGTVALNEVGFRLDKVPAPIETLTGRLEFLQDTVVADQLSWRLGASQFLVDGEMTTGPAGRFHDVHVQGHVDAHALAGMLPETNLPLSALHGPLDVAIRLSGSPDHPEIQGTIGLTETAFHLPGVFNKPAGQPAQVLWTATLPAKQTLRVNRGELRLPGIRLRGRGILKFGSPSMLDISLVSGPISLSAASAQGLPTVLDRGNLELTLAIQGTGPDWKAWQYRGWLALTDGALAATAVEHPIEDLYLRAKLTGHGADVKRLSFRVHDSHVLVSGSIRGWHGAPHAELAIESSTFDLDLLVPKGERSPVRDLLEGLAADGHVEASVDIDHGRYKDLTVTGLAGRVRIGDGHLEIPRLTGQVERGTFVVHGKVRLPKQQPAEVDLSTHITDLPFQFLERLAGDRDRLITGNFSARAAIHAHGRDPRGVLPSLEGAVAFSIKRGHFQGGTVMPRILAILNLPSLLQGKVDLTRDGVPFERIKGSFAIKNGLVREENLVLDSPVLKMSAAGDYDLATDQVKAVVAVSPLGSYSEFLKSVPLFGKIFVGDRKGFDTAMFEVTGSLHEPTVSYLPLQSFKTGVTGLAHLAFDVLKNTLLLPTTLLPAEEG
jgi:hypothetical protein